MRPSAAEPRQGREIVAQGASLLASRQALGQECPHPLAFPLPRSTGEGDRGRGRTLIPRLTPWATVCRPLCGLTSLTYFWDATLAYSCGDNRVKVASLQGGKRWGKRSSMSLRLWPRSSVSAKSQLLIFSTGVGNRTATS